MLFAVRLGASWSVMDLLLSGMTQRHEYASASYCAPPSAVYGLDPDDCELMFEEFSAAWA
ncbi:hypothetical protein ACFY3U_03315 [Micromonospora sp. NPDC000089]|uniref:hypothetical protein n=1 Tax=unclassified Micromonospora TaxID=2617518 RepID=UPI0036B4C5A7